MPETTKPKTHFLILFDQAIIPDNVVVAIPPENVVLAIIPDNVVQVFSSVVGVYKL